MAVLVGKKAPSFKATAVVEGEFEEGFSLDRYLGKQHVVLYFYPRDFTLVCPTEIVAFQDRLAEFAQRGVAIVGASTDSHYAHLAWLNTPRAAGGIMGVTYPLVADPAMTIARNYDVLAGAFEYTDNDELRFVGTPQAYRGLFLIDRDGIVRHQLVNDTLLGRSVDEVLRIVDALQHLEKYGEACPANWQPETNR
ncbi:MAG: peroxiredoxin [Hymenobacteraceae bacterium]|nr:peroxiredoxin [Hymenobacteraceae bacterium]